ncbi:PREDICTED: putative F-box/LRR-repeat protein At3g18150 [Camelina sativa]|uniref:F-box/LRR-repeat protein At3g18150 n=1 Tax=Camelina sativa TaxID=90675 RepID=A0ABM0YXX2_CAMSA|nr:PREDICTED: putative F-box/LRR-repeat protein At3g18150 [Camelina sativa]
MALEMLDKYQNVETLSFGDNFLKILSLAELRGSLFPKFKVKALTIETTVSHYIIPGIVRLLQNSPELKKLTFVDTGDHKFIPDTYIDENLLSHGLNPDQYWSSEARVFKYTTPPWSLEAQAVVSFIELVLKTTKTLEKMVISAYSKQQMSPL